MCVDCQEGTCRMGIDTVHLQCLCVLTFPKQTGSIITVLCRSVLCGNRTQVQWADHNHELHYLFSNRLVALSHIAYVGYNRVSGLLALDTQYTQEPMHRSTPRVHEVGDT